MGAVRPSTLPRRRLACLLAAALFPTFAAWLYFVLWAQAPWVRWLYLGCKLAQALLPLIGWYGLEMARRLPVPRRSPRAGLALGALTGGVLAAAVLAAYAGPLRQWLATAGAPARISARLAAVGAATPLHFVLLALALSIGHSLFEEYYWRAFVFDQLACRLPLTPAIGLASAAFALHHWIVITAFIGGAHRLSASVPLTLAVAAGGALWSWLYQRSRSVIGPWISHLMVDAALMVVGWELVFG